MDVARFTSKGFLIPGVISLIILVGLAALPFYGSLYNVVLITSILMYAILTVSWVMFSGSSGYLSLATATFFGIGIYVSALLLPSMGQVLPVLVVVLIAGLGSSVANDHLFGCTRRGRFFLSRGAATTRCY